MTPGAMSPVIIVGGGGHAKVVVDVLRLLEIPILGYTDPKGRDAPVSRHGVECLGDDDDAIRRHDRESVLLMIGVGGIADTRLRQRLFETFSAEDYPFVSAVHPMSVVARDVKVGEGAIVMAGAVVNAGSRVGENAIVNSGAAVDHDCLLGDHCLIATGAALSGGVIVGDGAFIGSGAAVVPGVSVGPRAVVAAGAVVTEDVPRDGRVAGIPARGMK